MQNRKPLRSVEWRVNPTEAVAIQRRLRSRVCRVDNLRVPGLVAGVDVGFEDQGSTTRAAVVVLRFPSLELEETGIARMPTVFPYLPGLLSFREAPAILAAFDGLKCRPDLLLCDGHGIAHPRRFGIACHLGVLLDIPSIGVGKTRLVGTHDAVGEKRGDWAPLSDKGEVIGAVLRTRTKVKPVYVSIGHRLSLNTAIEYVLACTPRYRLPETTRLAHRHASR